MTNTALQEITAAKDAGNLIPYIGPFILGLDAENCLVPSTPEDLVAMLTSKVSVPHKIRGNLTAAAQFIENFKHRKSVVSLMNEAYAPSLTPNTLHQHLAKLPKRPLLIVDTWYDDGMAKALAGLDNWGQIQGVSQAEHFGEWVKYYDAKGEEVEASVAETWEVILYKPIGSVTPANNYIVSDSDFVEVLTEIDIQTPIPALVQTLRTGSNFLFMGCRFDHQLTRNYARQVTKRSSDKHWAVIEGPLTKMEKKFVQEQNITVIDMPLAQFVHWLQTNEIDETLVAA